MDRCEPATVQSKPEDEKIVQRLMLLNFLPFEASSPFKKKNAYFHINLLKEEKFKSQLEPFTYKQDLEPIVFQFVI